MSGANMSFEAMFNVKGLVAAVTGGGGDLCGSMAKALAQAGVRVAILDLRADMADKVAKEICDAGGEAVGIPCDVLDRESVTKAHEQIVKALGPVDVLVNGAGGNHPNATTKPELSFFDLPADAIRKVFDLNFLGTLLPCQIFGRAMAERKKGCIVNISSMNAYRPLTRISAYSAAKAAVTNFTQWLAVHMAQEYSTGVRVNAIAPGFFLTEQNRFLLTDKETGKMTKRGQQILDHTPMARLGAGEDLVGALLWLISPSASFVTGSVVAVDGGFAAYSGV